MSFQANDPKPNDISAGKSPPKRGGKKSSPSSATQGESVFDEQSVLQHVRQTIRMLPGGLDIVGFFVTSSAASKKQAENTVAVNKALRSAYKLCSKINSLAGAVGQDASSAADGRMVLLTLDPTTGNKKPISTTIVDCRPDAQSSAPSTTVPFSYQNLRWRSLSTRLIFDVPLFVPVSHTKDTFLKQFSDAAKPWFRRLWTAKAIVNGSLRDEDEPLSSATTTAAGKGGKGKKQVEETEADVVDFFFVEENKTSDDQISNAKSEDGAVSMRIRGSMYCVAFVQQKATVGEGVQALKMDALRSLYGRCELHYDGMTVLEGEELDPVAVHQFPRRVLAPLADHSSLMVSDYLFEGEVSKDAVTSFKDLLDIDIRPESVEDKFERAPSEKILDSLLRSSSMSATPEGSIPDMDRMLAQDLDGTARNMLNKSSMVYLLLAIAIAVLAYLVYAMVGQ